MSVGRTFEESLQKAIRQVNPAYDGFDAYIAPEDLDHALSVPTDTRLFAIAYAMLVKNYDVERLHALTKIDRFFLYKLQNIVDINRQLEALGSLSAVDKELMKLAKQRGFSDKQIAKLTNSKEHEVRAHRKAFGLTPFVKRIDTVAAEYPAQTNYLYTTYNASTHDVEFDNDGTMVLGSGVYRIGSSVEFDWCAVRAIRTLRQRGFKTIMVNYNPETVSTDYDEADHCARHLRHGAVVRCDRLDGWPDVQQHRAAPAPPERQDPRHFSRDDRHGREPIQVLAHARQDRRGPAHVEGAHQLRGGPVRLRPLRLPRAGASVVRAEWCRHERRLLARGPQQLPLAGGCHQPRAPRRHHQVPRGRQGDRDGRRRQGRQDDDALRLRARRERRCALG
ncbi:hypothetical protein Golomagni_07123 [Golovinomyces magnicellulatus]|nr:hypothetical protein Golomagni_07123 [Golovinomyces magnicellulatus]